MAGWCVHDSLMFTGRCAAYPKKGTTLFRYSSRIGDTSHSSRLFACKRTPSVCLRPERIYNSSVGFLDAASAFGVLDRNDPVFVAMDEET